MPDYFLKKKSLLDRFKDNHGRTGYIQSARAEHTWSNPIKRNRRTKELNGWIKSFAGKKHIRKLARFNTLNNGKNENLEEAMNWINVTDNTKEILENGSEKSSLNTIEDVVADLAYAQAASDTAFGKPTTAKSILWNAAENFKASELNFDDKGSFIEDFIVNYEDQFREIYPYAVQDCDWLKLDPDFDKTYNSDDKFPFVEWVISQVAKELFKYAPADVSAKESKGVDEKLKYEKGHKNSKGEDAPWVIRSHEDNRVLASFTNKKDAEEHLKRMKQYSKTESNTNKEAEIKDKQYYLDMFDKAYKECVQLDIDDGGDGQHWADYFATGEDDPTTFSQKEADEIVGYYMEFHPNWEGEIDRPYKDWMENIDNTPKTALDKEITRILKALYAPNESKQTESVNMGGFKNMLHAYNAKGGSVKNGPWRICDGAYDLWFELYYNETPILGCTDNICKWYSNPETVGMTLDDYKKIEDSISSEIFAIDSFKMPESKQSEAIETYACYIEFVSESDAKEGMELVKGWHPTISKNLVVVEGLSKSAAEYLWKDWLNKCTDAGLDIKDKGEVYKDSIDESKDVSLKEIARTLDTAINKDGNYSVKDNTSGVTATDKDRTQTIKVSKDLKVELEDKDGKHSYEAQSLRDLSKYIRRAVKGEYVNEDFHKTQVKDAVYDVINRHNLNNAVKVSYLGNSVVCKYADRTLRIQPDLLTTMSTKDGDNVDTYPTNLKELDGYLDRVFGHYADELAESKQSEGLKLDYVDTITVPQWLWEAYLLGNEYGGDLTDDEQTILYDFKEKYKDCHLDDRGEEPDFHSRNDFDCYGGNCYVVDVYTKTDVTEKKSEKLFNKQELEAYARGADILDQLQYRFSFSFYSPKTYTDAVDTALAMDAEGDKRIAHETIGDSEFRLYTDDPYDAIRFRDGLSNRAGIPAEDLASTFRSAVGIRKNGGFATEDEQDTIGRYAAENYVSFSVSEDNSTMYVEGELPNVVEFFEAIGSAEPA